MDATTANRLSTFVFYDLLTTISNGIRVVLLLLLSAMLALLITGPGLYMRQRWEGDFGEQYRPDTNLMNKLIDNHRIVCGIDTNEPLIPDGQKVESGCHTPGAPAGATSVAGYSGTYSLFQVTGDLNMQLQLLSAAFLAIGILGTLVLLVSKCFDVDKVKPRMSGGITMLFLIAMVVFMGVVAGLNVWYSGCGDYTQHTKLVFDHQIRDSKSKYNGLHVDTEKDIAVQCSVAAYTAISVMAVFSALFYLVDAYITYQLNDLSKAMASVGPDMPQVDFKAMMHMEP